MSDGPVYVDKTGTDQKPNPMRDVYLEFPRAMMEIARVTAYGASKHAPRGWQTFEPNYGMDYHRSKVGRHLLKEEIDGPVNHEDGNLLHPAQTVWNMLAYLENLLKLRDDMPMTERYQEAVRRGEAAEAEREKQYPDDVVSQSLADIAGNDLRKRMGPPTPRPPPSSE